MNSLEARLFAERVVRCAVYFLATALLLYAMSGCQALKNIPGDVAIAAGSGAGAVGATAVGGPVGLTLWASVVGLVIWGVNLFLRPKPLTGQIPNGGAADIPPWYISPDYWWGVIFVTIAGIFVSKLVWSMFLSRDGRFHRNLFQAIKLLFQGQIRAAWLFLVAAEGFEHTERAESKIRPKE